eukprot:14319559-Alexandrium_andersonii.AAC.1
MLATAWSTASSCKRPLRKTGRAKMAFEPGSLMTRAVKDVSLPSLVRKQQSMATSGTVCSLGRAL